MTPGRARSPAPIPLGPAHALTLRRALRAAKALRRPRRVERITIVRRGVLLDLSCGHQASCGLAAQDAVRVGQGWPCSRCPPLNPGKSPAMGAYDRFGARSPHDPRT